MGIAGRLVLAFVLIMLLSFSAFNTGVFSAQSSSVGDNWVRAAYDDNNSGFNPQTQINQNNVQNLQVKWTYQIPQNPYTGSLSNLAGVKTRPLVINGTVYVATQFGRMIAMNASNGNQVWSFQSNLTALIANPGAGGSQTDLHHITSYGGIIYMQAADCTIYGLDAKKGTLTLMIPDPCKDIPGGQGYKYAGRSAPVLYEKGGVLILGQAGQALGRGFVAGYSATTGQLLWRWFVIPPRGGDPNWDSKYVVQLGNGSYVTGPAKGNIQPYPGDWGNSSNIVGGTSWAFDLIDQATGIFYIGTSVPEGDSLRNFPGPNLFGDSLVALNATTGQMLWFYQLTPHDFFNGNIPYQSGTLAQVQIGGKTVKAVFADAKNGYAYAFDAKNGSLLWQPVKLGLHFNDAHAGPAAVADANAVPAANMLITPKDLVGQVICPLSNSDAPPAYAYGTFYVPVQNSCATAMSPGPNLWSWQAVGPVNSTIYAIDGATGSIKWRYFMPNSYQGAGVAVSGGVVYAIDRTGVFYALNADNGKLLQTINLGGVGAAGVTIGADKKGNMMLFVTSGGVGTDKTTSGTVMALGLGAAPQTQTTTTSVVQTSTVVQSTGISQTTLAAVAGVAVIFVVATGYLALRRRKVVS